MKYIVILGDGMADEPIEELGGKTPLEYADTPELDRLAPLSEIGMVHTIPQGMKPGSDTANLSVLGYDPSECYSGRSPLEALSIGVPMADDDIAFRMNLVTVSDEGETDLGSRRILDHSSGEISTEDAAVLVEYLKKELIKKPFDLYVGTSYRHCLIWKGGSVVELAQPHDHLGETIGQYLPEQEMLRDMMEKSFELLKNHPINLERVKRGENPANCCWFWGAGTKPSLRDFREKTGKRGAMISAVDLLKGIAVGSGMKVCAVDGATGSLETNYEGKADEAVRVLTEDDCDFVYVHVEAPDEMGHQGSTEKKVRSIHYLDQRLIKRVTSALREKNCDFRMLVMPDHPTPCRLRTHTPDAIPYLLYDSTAEKSDQDTQKSRKKYNEREAGESGIYIADGHTIIDRLFSV